MMNITASKGSSYRGTQSQDGLDLLKESESIAVCVGPENGNVTWHLPKKLLAEHSTFFAAALDQGFAEQRSKCVSLPEDEPFLFEVFVQWLYLGTMLRINDSAIRQSSDDQIRTWILADNLGCSTLQDMIMLHLIEVYSINFMTAERLECIYDWTAPGSKIRKFALDHFHRDVINGYKAEDTYYYHEVIDRNEEIAKDYAKASISIACTQPKVPIAPMEGYLQDPSFKMPLLWAHGRA